MEVENKCRICLRPDNTMETVVSSITPRIQSTTSVIGLWNIYSRLLTINNPAFPDGICLSCTEKIQQTYSFLDKCEQSEKYFHHKIQEQTKSLSNEYIDISEYKENNTPPLALNDHALSQENDSLKVKNEPVAPENELDETFSNFTVNIDENFLFEITEVTNNLKNNSNELSQREKVAKDTPQGSFVVEANHFLDAISRKKSTPTESFECPACFLQFLALGALEKHILAIHISGNICRICNKVFSGTSLRHCLIHLPDYHQPTGNSLEKYKQSGYHYKFKSGYILKCEFCMKPFRSKQGYSHHMLVKHGCMDESEKFLQCSLCSKYLISKSALELHMRVHSGIKPHTCKFCLKKFAQNSHLIVHLRRHTGERPFKCKLCPKSFPDKSNFNKHLMLHTGEKPFKCDLCPRSYHRRNLLKIHLMCHSNQRTGWKESPKRRLMQIDRTNQNELVVNEI